MTIESKMAGLLTHLFDVWNEADIRYLILRNYGELPDSTGNDVDILLDPAQLKVARTLLAQAADEKNWAIHNTGEFACYSIHLFQEETLEQIHIDLMCGIKWHTLTFIDYQRMLDRRISMKNFHIPHPSDEAAVNLMTRLLYGGYVKENYKSRIRHAAQVNRLSFTETLHPWVGAELAKRIVAWAAEGNWENIEASCSRLRRGVLTAGFRRPGVLISTLWNDALRFVRRVVWSPGISIVFFGPDGCGKSSVADGLKAALERTFYREKGLHCHWKPLRPRVGTTAPTVDPHGQPVRNRMLSLLYFVHHYLPFVYGWWIYVKPVLFKNGLVVIDRYYYDFFIDRRRYRLSLPQWIVSLFFIFVKKPELVFCLDAAPEILQSRKNEVSFEECARQREEYRTLAENLPNGHVIDASQPLETVVRDVMGILLNYMRQRTRQRLPDASFHNYPDLYSIKNQIN